MSFADLNFLLRFLPACLIIYYLVPAGARKAVLTAESLIFYAFFDIRFVPLLAALILWSFIMGSQCLKKNRPALIIGIAVDAASLSAAKFLGQAVDSALLPVGMSFYIFKMIAYLADAYRGDLAEEGKEPPAFFDAAAYFSMFSQIISGPIMRYSDYRACIAFAPLGGGEGEAQSLKSRILSVCGRIEDGLTWFIAGLAAKVLAADHLSSLWESLNTIGYESVSTPLAWLGVYSRSMQLYLDFWGYSLMAGGIGVMFGFSFVKNFDQPYSAGGVTEFYRRWHMTLGRWFRDYIYIPMGGSRGVWLDTVKNLAVVWLLTGLWHGVTFNFLIWAAAVFFMILFEKALAERRSPVTGAVGRVNVLFFIPLTWVVFAITDAERLKMYFLRLFPIYGDSTGAVYSGDFTKTLSAYGIYLIFSLVFLIPGVYHYFDKHRRSVASAVILAALFVLSLISAARSGSNPFMYAQF